MKRRKVLLGTFSLSETNLVQFGFWMKVFATVLASALLKINEHLFSVLLRGRSEWRQTDVVSAQTQLQVLSQFGLSENYVLYYGKKVGLILFLCPCNSEVITLESVGASQSI